MGPTKVETKIKLTDLLILVERLIKCHDFFRTIRYTKESTMQWYTDRNILEEQLCTPRAGNPGNVLLTSRNPPK